jgi:transposase
MCVSAITVLGVDVGKPSLEFCGPSQHTTTGILNQPTPLRKFLAGAKEHHGQIHVVCEATGGYERLLVATCHALGLGISVVEPSRIRHFARSLGRLEKTDPIDAAVIREFGVRMPLRATAELEKSYQLLRDWVQLRDHYVERLKVERTFSQSVPNPEVQTVCAKQCDHLEALIAELEAKIDQFLQEQAPALNDQVQTLCLIKGLSSTSAAALLAYLPELGRCSNQAISKIAGLAPIADDSSHRHGPRHIQGGRAQARRVLYMLALVATQYNEHLKPFYQRLRSSGKPPKVALIAVARKLLVFLNSLLKPAHLQPA